MTYLDDYVRCDDCRKESSDCYRYYFDITTLTLCRQCRDLFAIEIREEGDNENENL